MVDFGGWAMPVSYAGGIIDEHRATRQAVGVFDVCHMGEIHFRGERAAEAVQRLITNDVGRLTDGRALYTVACLPSGRNRRRPHRLSGLRDPLSDRGQRGEPREGSRLVLRARAPALRRDRRLGRDRPHRLPGARGQAHAAAAHQAGARRSRRFAFVQSCEIAGVKASIARTGYTGEDGFEIFCDARDAVTLWDRLVEAAAGIGGKPVGLGARDTLRLEARLLSVRQRSRRDDHSARGGPRLGGEAGGCRLHRQGGAPQASAPGRASASSRLRDDWPRDRPPRLSALRQRRQPERRARPRAARRPRWARTSASAIVPVGLDRARQRICR